MLLKCARGLYICRKQKIFQRGTGPLKSFGQKRSFESSSLISPVSLFSQGPLNKLTGSIKEPPPGRSPKPKPIPKFCDRLWGVAPLAPCPDNRHRAEPYLTSSLPLPFPASCRPGDPPHLRRCACGRRRLPRRGEKHIGGNTTKKEKGGRRTNLKTGQPGEPGN